MSADALRWATRDPASPGKQSGDVGSEHRAGGKEELAPRWDHGVLDKVPSVKEREKMLKSFLVSPRFIVMFQWF